VEGEKRRKLVVLVAKIVWMRLLFNKEVLKLRKWLCSIHYCVHAVVL